MRQNTQIYFPQGSNSAPIKPFLDLKDKSAAEAAKNIGDHALTKQIKEKYEEKIAENKDAFREMVCAGQIIALFIAGEQILKINSFSGMPYINKTNRNDPQHIKCINDMQYFCTSFLDKYRSSKPDIIVAPYSNEDEAVAQARKANAVVDYLESTIYGKSKNWFDLNEGMNAQIWGWYGRRVRPDFTSKAFSVFKEILGEKEVPIGKGYGKCDECGYKGDKSKEKKSGKTTFHSCPQCESLEYDYDPPIMQMTPYVKSKEKIFLPSIICESLIFASTRWDLSKKFEESSWAIIEKSVEESALRRIIGNIKFPEGESGNDFGLDAIEMLASRGAAMNGSSSVNENKKDKPVLTEMYLGADDLWDIRIGGEEKTVEGHTLPKGKRMSDIYPDGALFLGTNGMSLVIGIAGEHHSDCSSSGVLHIKAGSGAGRGVGDSVEVQKQKNRRYSQIDAFMASRGTPATLMAENAIEPKYRRQIHNPKAIIPIKIQNFPEFKSLDQFIKPLQGESVPGDLISVTFDRLREMMQVAYHITDLGGSRPQGIRNDTATFAEIVDANADALFSPLLSIKADVNVDTLRNAFYKWVKYTPKARFIPFKKSRSSAVGVEISGKDVNAEYQWSYVPGSEAPKTRHTENQKRAAFFSMFGSIAEYFTVKQQFPKQIAEIERDFDVNIESDSYDNVGEMCRARWEKAKEILRTQAGIFEFGASLGIQSGQPDYLQILLDLEPSFEVTEPSIPEQVSWYQNLLMTEEGQAMSREERKLVSIFVISLKELSKGQSIEQQRDATEIQMASQQPMVDAQNAQAQHEAQANQAQTEMQMAGEAARVLNENEQTAQAQAHEKESRDQEDLMEIVGMVNDERQTKSN